MRERYPRRAQLSKIIFGKGGQRDIGDIQLSRRACYLVGINGDPRKKESIAAVQRYFVEQTRKQEIQEILDAAGSDRDRLEVCQKLEETEREMKSEAIASG
jgi:DNA-damage-inducible protein D